MPNTAFTDLLDRLKSLKNIDFKDPKGRKNFAVLCLCSAMFLLLVALLVGGFAHQKPAQPEEEHTSLIMEVPDGEDKDEILETKEMLSVHENLNSGGYKKAGQAMKDMFERSSTVEEDLTMRIPDDSKKDAALDMKGDVTKGMGGSSKDPLEIRDEAAGFFFDTQFGQSNVYDQNSEDKTTPAKPSPKKSSGTNKRATAQQSIIGEQPSGGAGKVSSSSTAESSAPRNEVVTQTEAEASSQSAKTIRRSGSVSSLRDSRGHGTKSLKTAEQFIVEDETRPYKVMFLRDEKIRSGQKVMLRLLEDMVINDILIPKNTHLSAICQLSDRLSITVSSIQINGKFYALDLQAYDNDGHPGLYCPDTQGSKISSEVGDDAVQIGQNALLSQITRSTSGNILSSGISILQNARGETAIKASAGYTFYLMRNQ